MKLELEGFGIHDINDVQAMMLFNIGDAEMTVGERLCEDAISALTFPITSGRWWRTNISRTSGLCMIGARFTFD